MIVSASMHFHSVLELSTLPGFVIFSYLAIFFIPGHPLPSFFAIRYPQLIPIHPPAIPSSFHSPSSWCGHTRPPCRLRSRPALVAAGQSALAGHLAADHISYSARPPRAPRQSPGQPVLCWSLGQSWQERVHWREMGLHAQY